MIQYDCESTTIRIRIAGGLDFAAIGGKRQGREVPPSLRVKPGTNHPVCKTQSNPTIASSDNRDRWKLQLFDTI
jgi:hypothetical protein